MNQNELEKTIQEFLPSKFLKVIDLTGTQDHWPVFIVSEAFEGKTRVEQHQMVMSPLQERFGSNEIHAMALKTFTPDKWEEVKGRYGF
mgnify:FL=1